MKACKRFLSALLATLLLLSLVPINGLEQFLPLANKAQAASYSSITLNVPWYSMFKKACCGISSVAMVEAYVKGYTSNDRSVFNTVLSYNGKKNSNDVLLGSYSYLGYSKVAAGDLTVLYNKLKEGKPVIVYRTRTLSDGTKDPHFSVVFAYKGSSSKLEKSGFKVLNTNNNNGKYTAGPRTETDLLSWTSGYKWTQSIVRTANKIPLPYASSLSNKDICYRYLTQDAGLNKAAAVGLMANIQAESSFNPACTYNEGGYYSYGICQWNKTRKTNLDNYCKKMRLSSTSLIGQLAFLKYELTNSYKSTVYNKLKSISNDLSGAKSAAEIVCRKYEIPADINNAVETRKNYAAALWKAYGGSVAVETPTITTTSVFGGVDVKIDCKTADAKIYYTTNGTAPDSNSTLYAKNSVVHITSSSTLKVVAEKAGLDKSAVKTAVINVGNTSAPVITVSNVAQGLQVKISHENANAQIFYTLDGTVPTTSSERFTDAFILTQNTTIKAIAANKGCKNSGVSVGYASAEIPAAPNVALENNLSIPGVGSQRKIYASNGVITFRWGAVPSAANYVVKLYNETTAALMQGNYQVGEWTDVQEDYETSIEQQDIVLSTSELGGSFDIAALGIPAGNYYLTVESENYFGKSAAATVYFEIQPDVNVVFMADDTVVESKTVPYGSAVPLPDAVQKKGHTFKRWDNTQLGAVTENMIVHAVFEKNSYNVNLIYDDQTGLNRSHYQTVLYDEGVVFPQESDIYTANSDYSLTGWTVTESTGGYDYQHVDGNMTLKPVFTYSDFELPLTIRDDNLSVVYNAGRNAYLFQAEISNVSDETVSGVSLITVLKTANGKVVQVKSTDLGEFGAGETGRSVSATINSTSSASKAEVYLIRFSDNKAGCALSTVKKVDVSLDGNIVYGEWSAWQDNMPLEKSGRIIEQGVFVRTREKATTVSNNSSLDGWTKYDTVTSYGNWSSWSTTEVTGTTTRQVQTTTLYRYYCKICPSCGNRQAYWATNCTSCKKYISTDSKTYLWSTTAYSKSNSSKYDSDKRVTTALDGKKWFFSSGNLNHTNIGRVDAAGTAVIIKKGYRSRTVSYSYYYYKWLDWSDWTITDYQSVPNNTETAEYKLLYRYKDIADSGNASLVDSEDTSGTVFTTSVNRIASDTDFSGKTATIHVYKNLSSGSFENNVLAIDQILIGENNSYEYSFIPKDDASNTSNPQLAYRVCVSIEGATEALECETIRPVTPKHTVTFAYEQADGTWTTVTQQVENGENAVVPEIDEVPGKVFSHWDHSPLEIREDTSIKAQYVNQKFIVVFVDWVNAAIVGSPQMVDAGSLLTYPDCALTAEGKTFIGWSYEENTAVTENLVVEACYSTQEFTVDFIGIDGNSVLAEPQSVEFGKSASLPQAPAVEGYTFMGWSNETCWWNVRENIQVRAMYVPSEKSETVLSDTEEGQYENGVLVNISTGDQEKDEESDYFASILYTLDDSDPDFDVENGEITRLGDSTVLFEPNSPDDLCSIWLEEDTTIKAVSFRSGCAAGEIAEFCYEVSMDEIPDLGVASVSYSQPAAYYSVGETTASLCMVVNNPYEQALEGYGYMITDTTTGQGYPYDNDFEEGVTNQTLGKVFNVSDLLPGTTYEYFFYTVIGDELFTSDTTSFTTQGERPAPTFKVRYHADEEAVAAENTTTVTCGTPTNLLTLSELGFSKAGYHFEGWKIRDDNSDKWYAKNPNGELCWVYPDTEALPDGYEFCLYPENQSVSTLVAYGTVDLYAQWKESVLSITTHPQSVTAAPNTVTTFTVKATGEGLTYQWRFRNNKDSAWINCTWTGYNTDTITASATAATNGRQYQCVVTDAGGNKAYSRDVTLTVKAVSITQHPAAVTAAPGTTATFSVKAAGAGLTYQWRFRNNKDSAWINCNWTGYNTDTIKASATAATNGRQYQCVVTDAGGNKAYSRDVTLTVKAVSITQHPAAVTAAPGTTATFTVKATGVGLTYQWRFRNNKDSAWINCTWTGYNTDTIVASATAATNGRQYQCVVTDAGGNKAYSRDVTLTVKAVSITQHPAAVTAAPGTTATFTVKATGVGLTYQWRFRNNKDSAWINCTWTGYNTDTIAASATAATNGRQYQCVVTDAGGNKAYSRDVTLTVK